MYCGLRHCPAAEVIRESRVTTRANEPQANIAAIRIVRPACHIPSRQLLPIGPLARLKLSSTPVEGKLPEVVGVGVGVAVAVAADVLVAVLVAVAVGVRVAVDVAVAVGVAVAV